MERRIKEDVAVRNKPFWGFAIIVIVLMLFCFFIGAWGSHDWKFFAEGVGIAMVLIVWVSIGIRGSLRDKLESGLSWMQTDDGLQRVYPSGKRETIRWEQIRHMRWVRFYGLIVRWEEPKDERQRRSGVFKEEFQWDWVYRQYRANLDVQKDEARELMSAMQNKTGLSDEQLMA